MGWDVMWLSGNLKWMVMMQLLNGSIEIYDM